MKTATVFLIEFILILPLVITFNCDRSSDHQNEMTFRVDKSLLAEKFVDRELGFEFIPPKDLLKVPADVLTDVQDQLPLTDFFQIIPRQVFLAEQSEFVCIISWLPELIYSDSSIISYQRAVKSQTSNGEIRQTSFLYNGFRIYQTLIISDNVVNFKLLIPQPDKKSFQIDYIIPKNIYIEKIEAIESSIGSIKRKK
ncbi:MAG: hypothetical protein SCK70_10810 [bacterium]|nr:hypothetical protein [bacterium]